MSELTDKIAAMERVLSETTVFDRLVMDQTFSQLSGLDLGELEPKMKPKLDRILSGFNHLAALYPDVADSTKSLPATALVSYAKIIEEIRDLVR